MKANFLFLLFVLLSWQVQSQEYPKCILPGDYPDPSILRDGKDYYMTHSPFYYAPGFLIWHSQDLEHWEPVCRAMTEWQGSAMAPDLVKYGERYYIYYPAAGTNWVIWADRIQGPWSEPVDLKVGGIDPGHIVDKDGNRFLYVSEGKVVPLSKDGLSVSGEVTKVYDGWPIPKHWVTEGMYMESPKLFFHDGYYYLRRQAVYMLIASCIFTVAGPWNKAVTRKADSFSVCVLNLGVGGLALLVLGLLLGGSLAPQSPLGIPVLLYLALVSGAGYVLWALLMKNNPVSRISVFGLVNLVVNVLLSALLNGEPLWEWQYLAALVLVCTGIWLVNRRGKEART